MTESTERDGHSKHCKYCWHDDPFACASVKGDPPMSIGLVPPPPCICSCHDKKKKKLTRVF